MDRREHDRIEALIVGRPIPEPEPTDAELVAGVLGQYGITAEDITEGMAEPGASITLYRFEEGEV